MESIGDTVMKHGQPSLGERGDAWERFSCIQEPPCIGEECSISHIIIIIIVQGAAGWFCSLVIHSSRPLSLEILAASRDEGDDHV